MTSLPSQPPPLDLAACLEQVDKVMEKRSGFACDFPLDKAVELGTSDLRPIPSFLEEGTWIAPHNGQLSVVRQLFVKAREVEKVHGLLIDEEHHRRVFREFPSLGALGIVELTVGVASLLQRCPTGEALDYFIGLIVDRAGIGISPYPRSAADVRRLIDVAGVNWATVENRSLRDFFEAAYLSRAPENFWGSYRDRPVDLAGQNPQIRSTLFDSNPTEVESDTRLDSIETIGITDELRSGNRDTVALLRRFADSRRQYTYWSRLSHLVRTLPLVGATVRFKHLVTPELCDALLEAGTDMPEEPFPIQFNGWTNGEDCPEPTHLARSPFSHTNLSAPVGLFGENAKVLLAHENSCAMLSLWLGSAADELLMVPTAPDGLHAAGPPLSPQGHALFPGQVVRLPQLCDGPQLLAGALRNGMLTEHTWSTLRAAAAELHHDDPTAAIILHGSGTVVGVAVRGRVI